MPKADSFDPVLWMDYALKLAQQADAEDEVPVGAVVVFEGRAIGEGRNRRETDQDPCGHAEIFALRSAAAAIQSWRLTDAILVVTLEPCPMCLAACQQARVARVIYGAADPKGGALSLGYPLHSDPRANHRFEVNLHPHPESERLLKDFFRRKRQAK